MLSNYPAAASHISDWMREYAETAGKKKLVIPVSGGLDSAVASTLAAMTGLTVIAVTMPVSSKNSPLAEKHLTWLREHFPNVETYSSDIGDVYRMAVEEYALPMSDLAKANLQSRMRMVRAYQFAGEDALVVGTGNKVEDYGLGFFTKYGDGGVDFSPLGDLTKTEVRFLAIFLDIIPSIIAATPTDGLWEDGRSDEEALGMTYVEAELCMQYHENLISPEMERQSIDDIIHVIPEAHRNLYRKFRKWHDSTRHKMYTPPICEIPEEFYEQV